MKWHLEDIPSLLAHLPHAVHDLMHHEDKQLVSGAKNTLLATTLENTPRHSLVGVPLPTNTLSLDQDAQRSAPSVTIEKTIDPFTQRSAQNMQLLIHDYLYHLPSYEAGAHEGEKLLEHWRKIIQEQPHRLAVAKSSYWNTPEANAFWRQHLSSYRTDMGVTADAFPESHDWQRMAGTHIHDSNYEVCHPAQFSATKARQWQDLVIRSRLHQITRENTDWF
jgi:hypothetical protein